MPTGADAPRVRSFVAIGLAEPARSAVTDYLDGLRSTTGGVAWTRAENLHLTLKFLGDVERDRVAALADRLGALAAATPPFSLRVAGVGAFPSLARPRVLWVGVAASPLASFADAVELVCRAAGFPAEARPLRPHVTLGRVREGNRRGVPELGFLARDGGREFGASPVADLVLFRSELGSGGARHTPLARLPLGAR
jgi:2'-5' RNA ligase